VSFGYSILILIPIDLKVKMSLVSIITVTYNSEKYLEKTIQSVVGQTYSDIEYIIIDGASKDNTVEIIKKYEKEIDYWISEPDNGIYDAMNKGIKAAKGDIIGIINSDDWLESNTIEKVVNAAKSISSNEFVIHGNIARYNSQSNLVGKHGPKKIPLYYLFSTPFKHPATFLSKSVYGKVGLYDQNCGLAADYDLMMRIICQNITTKHIDEILTNVRLVGISTGGELKASNEKLFKILKNNTQSLFLAYLGIFVRKINDILHLKWN
jgi:glycosyltransferase involved in cell wall biosynthesis